VTSARRAVTLFRMFPVAMIDTSALADAVVAALSLLDGARL
jgi:hypothetical protein